MAFANIILASDFSPGAQEAFRQALELARQHGARLILVHVVPPLLTPSPLLDDLAVSPATMALRDSLRDSSSQELAKLAAQAAGQVEVETRLLEGDPARELIALAKETGAELMIMGSTGVSGLAVTVFGSVAQKLVRRAPCSGFGGPSSLLNQAHGDVTGAIVPNGL